MENERTGTVELRADGDLKSISGYAAVFYRADDPGTEFMLWDGAVERIMPGAFDNVESDDVRALFNHESSQVLGRNVAGTLKLEVDSKGLNYTVQPATTRVYRDAVEMIERGDVSGSSFQFRVTDDQWRTEDGQEIREIRGVKLVDVGPVTFPAYQSATTEAASSEARSSHQTWQNDQQASKERQKLQREVLGVTTATIVTLG